MTKPPAHLIRPIIHPKLSDGRGASYRTQEELALMNDELRHPAVQAEREEAWRVAGFRPDGSVVQQVRMLSDSPVAWVDELTGRLQKYWLAGEVMVVTRRLKIQGGELLWLRRVNGSATFVVSATQAEVVE